MQLEAAANGNGTAAVPARRGRRSREAIEAAAATMNAHAATLESEAQGLSGIPLAQEAYSEAVAILRDGAQRIVRPLTPTPID